MDQRLHQQLVFESNKKSAGVAYLLWFFVGSFGAHRFYLGETGTGIAQLLLLLLGWIPFFLGWVALGIWLFVDLFLIPGIATRKNLVLANQLAGGIRSDPQPASRLDY